MTILVNFGGPRTLREVTPFLEDLLSDQDVIQTPLPEWLHRFIFSSVARKRAQRVVNDYRTIGGGSPIYADTEKLAKLLKLSIPSIYTFHRYLRKTHRDFIRSSKTWEEDLVVFPLFPHFSYATTGSIARWFVRNLPLKMIDRMQWIPSYPTHPAYIAAFVGHIKSFLKQQSLIETKTLLLFSAHGLPQSYVDEGDPYVKECEASFHAIRACFPEAQHLLSYQSQFGKALWTKPSTKDVCTQIQDYARKCDDVVFIPLSFTSDHIETLFEIEQEYLPVCRERGIRAHRCPALGFNPEWIRAISEILKSQPKVPIYELIR